ncbi:MAG: hypothetical protein QOI99_270, partial [Actinomycetota bacterium]|nr:hypothetical protein [Actinomycetota bacterium]
MTWSRNSDGVEWKGAGRVMARSLGQKPGSLKGWILAVVLAVVAGPFVGLIMPARAGVGLGVTPTFPPVVTVGQTGLPATLQIVNNSTPPDDVDPILITSVSPGVPAISLVPSCGTPFSTGPGDCPLASADPGVFALSATGVGEAGTACAGIIFTITVVDPATGKVAFTPATAFSLQPPGSPGDTCRIDFT